MVHLETLGQGRVERLRRLVGLEVDRVVGLAGGGEDAGPRVLPAGDDALDGGDEVGGDGDEEAAGVGAALRGRGGGVEEELVDRHQAAGGDGLAGEGGGVVDGGVLLGDEGGEGARGRALGVGPELNAEYRAVLLARAEADVADAGPGVEGGVVGGADRGHVDRARGLAGGAGGGLEAAGCLGEAGVAGADVVVEGAAGEGGVVDLLPGGGEGEEREEEGEDEAH